MTSPRGFALPTAVFVLVILSMLGAFMLSLSTSQSITSAQDVQGTRAHLAARAGMERALFSLQAATSCPVFPGLTVDGFTVTITCATPATPFNEAGTSRYIFRITSTATSGGNIGSLGYIERAVTAYVEF